ncbi:MAG: hypothetical protein LBG58_10095 [Planctomycetaceae bacterium]|nr:hypothetical protein [Planctomycetaceae bacterium]
MVGNLSPKGCAGWFIIRVVRGWFLISLCKQGQVGYRRLSPTRPFGERSPTID